MKTRFASRLLTKSIFPLLALGACADITYSQTTRTWDGGGVAGTNMDAAVNWSGDVVPGSGDTGQWDGTVGGALSLIYTATGTGASLTAGSGFFLNILGTQTGSLTINEASGTVGLRLQNLTVASGAGALTFGGTAGADILTLGAAAVPNHTWTNSSSNPVTFGSDVQFGAGGGVTHGLTLTGTGTWNVNTSLIRNGSGTINVIKDGAGTLNLGNVNALGNAAFTILAGSLDSPGGALIMTNTTQSWNGDFTFIGTNSLNLGTGTVALNASRQVTVTANTLTVGGIVSGTGFGLTKAGAGTLTFTGANTYSGGTVINGGKLIGTANGFNAGSITINASGTLTFTGANQTTTSTLTGSGAILNDTANTIVITGDHTGFTGTFTHSAGANNTQFNSAVAGSQNASYSMLAGEAILAANGDYTVKFGSLSSSLGQITRGGNTATGTTTLEVGNLGTSTTLSGSLNNGATKVIALTKVGAGTLTLSSSNTYTGATTINGGTLQIGNGGSTGALSATTAIANNAALVVNRFDALTMGNAISGTGTLTKQGGDILTLSGANNYSGLSTISSGNLTFVGSSTTGSISVEDFTTLGVKVTNVGNSVLTSTNNPSVTFGTADATSFVVDFNNLANPTVAVANLGTGVVTLNGVVDVSLANPNALTTTPNNTTLKLVSYGSKVGSGSWNLTTPSAGHTTFALNPTATALYLNVTANPVTWTGALSEAWDGQTLGSPKNWKLPNNSPTDFISGDTVQFTNTASRFTVDITGDVAPGIVNFSNTSNAYTIGSTSGFGITSGLMNLNGSGTVTINNSNSYTGATTINGGTLTLNGSLTASAVTLAAGTLNLNSNTALGSGALTINSGTLDSTAAGVVLSANTAQNWNGDFAFAGTNNLDMGSGVVTLGGTGDRTVTVAGTLTVGEIKSGAAQGLTKQGSGTLVVTSDGANTAGSVVNGVLNVAGGTLQINRPSGVTGDFVAAGIIGGGNITNGAATGRWIFSNAAAGTFNFSGTLSNGAAGILGFNKAGASTQTLSGNNTYSDTTTVGGGTLILTGTNSLSGPTNITSGTLSITGTNSAGGAVTATGSIGNPAILNLQNSNALGTSVVTAATRHGGVQLQGNIVLPSTVTFITSNDGTTSAAVPYAIGNISGNNTINGTITLTSGGGGSIIQSDSGSLTLAGNITIAAAQTSRGIILQGASTAANTFSGVLSDLSGASVASITKNGTGTWTIAGANTYSGVTAVNAGMLIVSGDSPAATGTVTVATGATLGGNGDFGGALVVSAGAHHALAVAATPGAQAVREVASLDLSAVGDILDLTAAATPAAGSYTLVHTTSGTITGQTAGTLNDTVVNLTGLSGTVAVVGGDLVLTVGSASPFGTWIAGYPSIPVADRDPGDDPDGDGHTNMVEFALGGTPNNGGDNAKIYSIVADSDFDGDALKELLLTIAVRTGSGTFTGATSKSALSDDPAYGYIVEGSLNLTTFGETVNVVPTAVPPVGVTLPTDYTWKTFSLNGSNGVADKGFLRVLVTH
ncbi:MAG: autotransporter-associated beta strand repeat-containing protein [Luteolibacter sp.]|uniref:beta strand repeat-containing protein n=1 Tax=Luteolibacter sp. TaxID=1962973 RepID=UPI003264C540